MKDVLIKVYTYRSCCTCLMGNVVADDSVEKGVVDSIQEYTRIMAFAIILGIIREMVKTLHCRVESRHCRY